MSHERSDSGNAVSKAVPLFEMRNRAFEAECQWRSFKSRSDHRIAVKSYHHALLAEAILQRRDAKAILLANGFVCDIFVAQYQGAALIP